MTNDKNHLPYGHLCDELTQEGGVYATPELSRVLNMARGGHRPEVDMQELIDEKFTTGEGVLIINPDLDNATIAAVIRRALKTAKGKSFKVVQTPGSIGN